MQDTAPLGFSSLNQLDLTMITHIIVIIVILKFCFAIIVHQNINITHPLYISFQCMHVSILYV